MSRAMIARWWKTTPNTLRGIPKREFAIMAEFMERAEKAREEAIEAARMGYPSPGQRSRGRPRSGDTVVDGRMEDRV